MKGNECTCSVKNRALMNENTMRRKNEQGDCNNTTHVEAEVVTPLLNSEGISIEEPLFAVHVVREEGIVLVVAHSVHDGDVENLNDHTTGLG